jgi:magnesium-transporting ATPase (P-type)
MSRPPRPPSESLIQRPMLIRAWLFLGAISAALSMTSYFLVLHNGGWTPGAPTDPSSSLHHLYLQATTITFLSMVACQIGTAFACRTERVSLRSIGVTTNRLLLWGVAFEVALSAMLVAIPPLQSLLGTAVPDPAQLVIILPFPFIVWGADELRRWIVRRRRARILREDAEPAAAPSTPATMGDDAIEVLADVQVARDLDTVSFPPRER